MAVRTNALPDRELRKKIAAMAQTMSEYEIADKCGMSMRDVLALMPAGRRRWAAKCLRTGRVVTSISERGAYLKAQIAGFADWCFVEPGGA